MGPRRRAVLATLLAVLVILPTVPAGTRDSPEITDNQCDVDPTGNNNCNNQGTADNDWADIVGAWVSESDDAVMLQVEVRALGSEEQGNSQGDGGSWAFHFNASESEWLATASWSGSDLTVSIDRNGTAQGDAVVSGAIVDNAIVEITWTSFRSDVGDDITLTDLYAFSAGTSGGLAGADCQGENNVLDCAPENGFGSTARIGRPPPSTVSFEVTPTNRTVMRGDHVNVSLWTNNSAFGDVSVDFTFDEHDGFEAGFNRTELEVPGGTARLSWFNLTVGDDVVEDELYVFNVTMSPSDGAKRLRRIQVFVEAPPPPPPDYALDLQISPPRSTARRGETVTHDVSVANDGANDDVVDLTFVAGPGWAALDDRRLRIDAFGSENTTLRIDVPSDAEPGQVTHAIEARSTGDENVTERTFVVTDVQTEEGFYQQWDRRLAEAGLGGIVPTVVLVVLLAVLVGYVVVPSLRRQRGIEVEAGWEDEEEGPEDDT